MNKLIFIKNLFNNRPLVLIILYSSIFISLPIIYSKFSLFFLVISLLIITGYLFNEVTKTKEIRTFQYILFAYSFWIMLAYLIHYSALSTLEPLTYITVQKQNAAWGLTTLKDITLIYLFFPVFCLIGFYLFKSSREGYRFLYFLTIFIIPSLIIAIYQGLFDIEFLNNPYFAKRNRVSGLNVDANGFGLSLFLLFPLCIFAILQIQGLWKKLFFGLLTAILFWCLFLSGSRTGFLGVIIFITILPWIWVWVDNKLPGKRRRFLILSPIVVVLLIIVTMGIMSAGKNFSPSLMLMERFSSSYLAFKKGGVEEVLKISTRSVLWLQAYRLTELSPLSGWGPGGFYRNLHNIRFLHGEKRWTFDNANNHYLQISSELGLLGAFFNILLHFIPLWMVFRIRKRVQNRDERWAIGISFVTVGIMMLLFVTGPHIMNLSVQWIFVVFLAYLFTTALKYGYSFSKFNIKLLLSSFVILTMLFLWGTYINAFGKDGYKARQYADWWPFKYEKNCYTPEKSKDGWICWCNKDAALQILVRRALPAKIKLALVANNPDIQLKPVTVKYGGKEGAVHEVVLKDHSWKTIEIPVTRDYIFEMTTPNKSLKRYFVLSLDVSRTWIPKEWGINDDTRELGLAVLIPKL